MHAASRIRQLLLREANALNYPALLGPHITTLKQWIINQSRQLTHQPVSHYCQELILYDALVKHPDLYGKGNPWTLTNELLSLFDELNLNQARLPNDLDDFIGLLSQAYGIQNKDIAALGREARLVHTLWHAWLEQLQSMKLTDKTTDYVLSLAENIKDNENKHEIYLTGFYDFNRAEFNWLGSQHARQARQIILHGQTNTSSTEIDNHPDAIISRITGPLAANTPAVKTTAYSHCINTIFSAPDKALKERAETFSNQHPTSPFKDRLSVFAASNAEDEAIAIDLQVRRWLLAGKKNIGIITENRRLARRVRALLERANISITDSAGWALSTSSAASVVERWLQAIEEDFAHEPLLDVLKSPFIFSDWDKDERLRIVYRLENDIILHENIPGNLQRFRTNIHFRARRLNELFPGSVEQLMTLIERLEQAAAPLLPLFSTKKTSVKHFLAMLIESLKLLGVYAPFEEDIAGERILQELEQMQLAAEIQDTLLDWTGFRIWLGRTLEHTNFQPANTRSPVLLMGMTQSNLHFFDALIIGAVEKEFLPGAASHSPFFNDGVRAELGLNASTHHLGILLYHFRRLLESAPTILLTHRRQQEGEEILPSPWLELLQSFHLLAYDEILNDPALENMIHHPDAHVFLCDTRDLPLPANQPKVSIVPKLLPETVSASAYQDLINCPYQYFARRCLKLSPSEEIRAVLEKGDYGSRVHRCLQAFHEDASGLPGPFVKQFDDSTRQEATKLLGNISQKVFANDLEDNFQHRGWLKRWQRIIPAYIDWQIKRARDWQVKEVETKQIREEFVQGISLEGRLDRVDKNKLNLSIIDYKTGEPPHQDNVDNGEAIQLPFYALLAEQDSNKKVTQVAYLYIDNEQARIKAYLQEEQLEAIKQEVSDRLKLILNELIEGKAVPAWGDPSTCSYCEMEGLCRKTVWENVSEIKTEKQENKNDRL